MKKDLRFIVIGAGMAGMLAAIRLRVEGYRNVTVLEKGPQVGGTWRENRYLGLYCDVPAHDYTYSFAPNPEWSGYLAPGAEIQQYFEDIAERYALTQIIRFHTEVVSCTHGIGGWTVCTRAGDTVEADVIIAATGVLHHPRMPEIADLDTFEGPKFHSARWPDTIDLAGQRVGVIGNGSTGVQLVTALAGVARQVSHFQRSPQWIMPLPNFPYTDKERQAFRENPALIEAVRKDPNLVQAVHRFTTAIANRDSAEMAELEAFLADYFNQSIADPMLRERLRPTYRAACKRLIFSATYYAVVQRPDVAIVTDRIDRVTPQGVLTCDGIQHELEVLILATGFHADRYVRPIAIRGRHGIALDTVWAQRPHAYLAISIPEFPNFFLLNGPGAPVGNFSLIDVAERQWTYIAQLIAQVSTGACREIAPTQTALAAYESRRIAAAQQTIFGSGCTSWYLDATGIPNTWPWDYATFAQAMTAPNLEDFNLQS